MRGTKGYTLLKKKGYNYLLKSHFYSMACKVLTIWMRGEEGP
jgi:hypothetical protein